MPILVVVLLKASTEGNASSTKLCSWGPSTPAWCVTSRLALFNACNIQDRAFFFCKTLLRVLVWRVR